ncbi:MAG TPA: FHA domain-containing protein [Anaerolineales bacterium]|nr:FHA domain-containing protein [Anaerolineales bacterium]
MNLFENICPVCKNKNELEAVVCVHCGAALEGPFMDPGAKTKTTDMPGLDAEIIKDWSIDKAAVPERGIAIYVEGEFKPAYVDSNGEFVLGRKMGTTSEVLLDLSPLGGYHLGLSRRHAVVRRAEHGYEVLDLGSVNGTWLNDERLVPHKAYPLASGSHLRLGRMRLFVLYRPFAETPHKR